MEWHKVTKFWMYLVVGCIVVWGASFAMAEVAEEGSGTAAAGALGKDMSTAILLITTITGFIKTLIPKIPDRLIPLLPVILGVLYGTFVGSQGGSWQERLMYGISFGLTASGAHRTGKVTTGNATK